MVLYFLPPCVRHLPRQVLMINYYINVIFQVPLRSNVTEMCTILSRVSGWCSTGCHSCSLRRSSRGGRCGRRGSRGALRGSGHGSWGSVPYEWPRRLQRDVLVKAASGLNYAPVVLERTRECCLIEERASSEQIEVQWDIKNTSCRHPTIAVWPVVSALPSPASRQSPMMFLDGLVPMRS